MPHKHSADFWHSAEGIELLAQVDAFLALHEGDFSAVSLQLARRFKSVYDRETVIRGLEIMLARRKAWSQGMPRLEWLLRKHSLEQSTHPRIADAHAAKFGTCRKVLEICTGAGFISAALARKATQLRSIEADPELAVFAQHNFALQGLKNIEVLGGRAEDRVKDLNISEFDGFWADPSRRDSHGRRIMNPALYKPALDFLMDVGSKISGPGGIKVSPALSLPVIPNDWSREWIGFGRECRELVFWHGTDLPDRSVKLIDHNISWSAKASAAQAPQVSILQADEAAYLLEPHPALIASGLAPAFFSEAHIHLLDPELVIGVSTSQPPSSPFYTVFRQVSNFAFTFKRLQAELKAIGWGKQTEIKKRRVNDNPDEIRRKLTLTDARESGTVLLLGVGRKKIAVLAKRTT